MGSYKENKIQKIEFHGSSSWTDRFSCSHKLIIGRLTVGLVAAHHNLKTLTIAMNLQKPCLFINTEMVPNHTIEVEMSEIQKN